MAQYDIPEVSTSADTTLDNASAAFQSSDSPLTLLSTSTKEIKDTSTTASLLPPLEIDGTDTPILLASDDSALIDFNEDSDGDNDNDPDDPYPDTDRSIDINEDNDSSTGDPERDAWEDAHDNADTAQRAYFDYGGGQLGKQRAQAILSNREPGPEYNAGAWNDPDGNGVSDGGRYVVDRQLGKIWVSATVSNGSVRLNY